MDYYNQLSDSYNLEYLKNLTEFQRQYPKGLEETFVQFYPSFGVRKSEQADFIFYGQAVNGWDSFNLNEILDDSHVNRAIAASNEYLSSAEHTPLDWVNVQWSNSVYKRESENPDVAKYYQSDYRTSKSFFWNVIYKVVCDYYLLGRDSKKWTHKLVWSNLYKIAPDRKNPSPEERLYQQPISSRLIRMELEEIKPKYCIVLTNEDWWLPFQEILTPSLINRFHESSEVITTERFNDTLIILTKRPALGNSDMYAKKILESIALGFGK